jgi:hypothetical protein
MVSVCKSCQKGLGYGVGCFKMGVALLFLAIVNVQAYLVKVGITIKIEIFILKKLWIEVFFDLVNNMCVCVCVCLST